MTRVIPIFIASPNDVQSERNLVHKTIMNLSSRLQSFGITLTPVRWKDFAPIAAASPEQVTQDLINKRLESCAIFVGILYKRYGTAIDEYRDISGTQSEFEQAIQNRDRIKILTYFKSSCQSSRQRF